MTGSGAPAAPLGLASDRSTEPGLDRTLPTLSGPMTLLRIAILVLFTAVPASALAEPITFEVEVPRCTPGLATGSPRVLLRSNRTGLDVWTHDELEHVEGTLFRGTFEIEVPRGAFRYKYSTSICDASSCLGIEKALTYDGTGGEVDDRTVPASASAVHDHVMIWRDARLMVDGATIGMRTTEQSVAFCGPYLSVTDERGTEVTVGYDSYAGEHVRLEYGPTDMYGSTLEGAGSFRNFFTLRDLVPGEVVHYRIVEAGVPGPDHTFRAPVTSGTPFRFALLGDTQYYGEEQRSDTSAVVDQVLAFDPELVLSVGDLVASEPGPGGPGGWRQPEMGRWNVLFGMIDQLVARAPFMVAMGNHEEDAPYFWDVFQFPEPAAPAIDHYAFRYGSVHFSVLYTGTTDGYDQNGILESQSAWLERTLEAAALDPEVRFKVLLFHRGPFSQGANHPRDGWALYDAQTPTRPSWHTLVERHGVDLVLAGHNHNFTYAASNGVRYLTACSGAPTHPLREPWDEATIHAERVCTANLFEVGRTLRFTARRVDGTTIDEASFALCREATDCEELAIPCGGGEVARYACDEGECAHRCEPAAPDAGMPDAAMLDAAIDAHLEDARPDSPRPDATRSDAGSSPPPDGCACQAAGVPVSRVSRLSIFACLLALMAVFGYLRQRRS